MKKNKLIRVMGNAISRAVKPVLEMSGTHATEIQFRPKARLMRLLGENLVKDEVTAIIELVKNSHDADATTCTVKFEQMGEEQIFTIDDDGDGMSVDTVSTAWTELGTSNKVKNPVTKKGRRVLGDKGIGRFAADKIGKKLDLYTKTFDMNEVIHFHVNWKSFDDADGDLGDVKASYELEKMNFKPKGTRIVLSDLRKIWVRNDLEKLRLGLLKLLPPNDVVTDFEIRLKLPQYPDLEGLVRNDILEKSHFRISSVLKDGVAMVTIVRNLPTDKTITTKKITVHEFNDDKIIDEKELVELGPVSMSIGAFLKYRRRGRNKKTVFPEIEITKSDEDVLDEWHGVRVYSDDFWIYPYGEDWFNWLDLDQRRVQSPGRKFDNRQLVGFVKITKDGNPGLVQQINREGLVHNRSYEILQSLVISVISELETDALVSGARKRKKDSDNPTYVSATSYIEDNVADLQDISSELQTVYKKLKTGDAKTAMPILNLIMEKFATVNKSVENEMIIYDKFAALGKFASYVVHQLNLAIDPVSKSADTLKNYISRLKFDDDGLRVTILETLSDLDSDLNNLFKQVNKWEVFTEKNTPKEKILICKYLNQIISEFSQLYDGLVIHVDCDLDLEVNVVKSDLWNILVNLIDNSYYWTKGMGKPTVAVMARIDNDYLYISVKDNGRGIPKEDYDKIFIPGYSTKPRGKGLGLMIASTAAWKMGGELMFMKDNLGDGATFEIRVPLEDLK